MDLYTDQIIDLYKNPLNKRKIKGADITHSGVNPACGDHLRIYIKLDKKGLIRTASWEGAGCAISTAAASLLTEHAKRKNSMQILKLSVKHIEKLLGVKLSPSRVKCGMLCLETMQGGIKRRNTKHEAPNPNQI